MTGNDVFYSTGRGGAGNITSGKEIPSPKIVPQGSQTPAITQSVYSTGRGGAGNMHKNDDKVLSRIAQDVDDMPPASDSLSPVVSAAALSPAISRENPTMESHITVGRGGYGNVMATRKEEEHMKQSLFGKMKSFIKKDSN